MIGNRRRRRKTERRKIIRTQRSCTAPGIDSLSGRSIVASRLDVTDLLAVAMANRPIELQIKKSHLSGAAPRREREKTKFISYCDNILQEIIEAVTLAVVRLGLFRDNRKREREGVFFLGHNILSVHLRVDMEETLGRHSTQS